MASEVTTDSDCIVISELSDESGADEKSAQNISVSDSVWKQTLPSSSCNDQMKFDYVETECNLPVQQTGNMLQSTNDLDVTSSQGSQNQSKHFIYCPRLSFIDWYNGMLNAAYFNSKRLPFRLLAYVHVMFALLPYNGYNLNNQKVNFSISETILIRLYVTDMV